MYAHWRYGLPHFFFRLFICTAEWHMDKLPVKVQNVYALDTPLCVKLKGS